MTGLAHHYTRDSLDLFQYNFASAWWHNSQAGFNNILVDPIRRESFLDESASVDLYMVQSISFAQSHRQLQAVLALTVLEPSNCACR